MEKNMKGHVKNYQSEEGAPVSLNTLPEELTEKIFSFLSDPKDLLSVTNTSPQFNRILNPKKTVFIFGEVFPLLFADLDRNDIYNCRVVCKQWNHSVDNYLQSIPETRYLQPYPCLVTKMASGSNPSPLEKAKISNSPPYSPLLQPLLRSKALFPMNFAHPAKLSNFLQETSTHPRNPFLLRMIILRCDYVRRREMHAYWREITDTLLPKFGQQVHHLSFSPTTGPGTHLDLLSYYRRLWRTLQRLPNLKHLHLYRHGRCMSPVSGQLATWIQGYINTYPLPPLPQLETLTESFLAPLPREPIINELMRRYSSQLKTIYISLAIWQEDIPEFSSFPQCTALYICVDDCLMKWKRLCGKLEVPNLRKLSLNIKKTGGISQILQPLEHPNFQSLVYLRLRFVCKLGRDRRGRKPGRQFLLEHVKTLEVLENSNVPYDSLLGCLPKLEYMLVCCDPRTDYLKHQVSSENGLFEIRKWMYSNDMYKSNIWTKMEHLKEFIFAKLGNTRDTETEIQSKVIYNRRDYNLLTQVINRSGGGCENLEE